jgi:hypothetical protein
MRLLFALIVSCSLVWAHGVHASLGTAHYSAANQSLEITLAFSADDVEALLRKQTGKQIEVDHGAEKLVFAYLERCLAFKTARTAEAKPLKWIGMEVSVQKITAYLEVKLTPEELAGLMIRNDLLLDSLPDQVNLMSVRRDGVARPSDHLFRVRGEWQGVKLAGVEKQ